MVFGRRNDRSRIQDLRIPVNNSVFPDANSVKNLGLLIADQLNFPPILPRQLLSVTALKNHYLYKKIR